MTSAKRLPFHPLAIVLGAVGAALLALGLLGAVTSTPIEWFPLLSETSVWISLALIGGLLLMIEAVMIVLGVRGRDPWD